MTSQFLIEILIKFENEDNSSRDESNGEELQQEGPRLKSSQASTKEASIQRRVEKLGTSNTHNTTLSIEYRFFFRRGTEIPEEPADGLSPMLLKYHIGPP